MISMPQPHWILQKNLTDAHTLAAITATLAADAIGFEEVFAIPFSDSLPEMASEGTGAIIYGSTTLILNAYQDARFRKAVFFDPRLFCMENYVARWGRHMLNHDSHSTTFSQLATASHLHETTFFIRPDADSKAFSGQVMTFAEILAFGAQLNESTNPHLNLATPVSISLPKTIEKEWRSFVVDGKIISTTRYLREGALEIDPNDLPEKLLPFVQGVIEVYQPHPVFVIDIALCAGKFAILECNCFNGTGFYGHNIPKVLRAVNAWMLRKDL
jgi:hypothetical protein